MAVIQPPPCKNLVLDAGPLLSLSPLRGLAETYLTVPQVLAELKDRRAREHFERLGLISGVKIGIKSPDSASLAHGVFDIQSMLFRLRPISVIQWAKKTGDYAVLSHPDLCVLALTYMLQEQGKKAKEMVTEKPESEQASISTLYAERKSANCT
jgi:RNA-binding protein NOB1